MQEIRLEESLQIGGRPDIGEGGTEATYPFLLRFGSSSLDGEMIPFAIETVAIYSCGRRFCLPKKVKGIEWRPDANSMSRKEEGGAAAAGSS